MLQRKWKRATAVVVAGFIPLLGNVVIGLVLLLLPLLYEAAIQLDKKTTAGKCALSFLAGLMVALFVQRDLTHTLTEWTVLVVLQASFTIGACVVGERITANLLPMYRGLLWFGLAAMEVIVAVVVVPRLTTINIHVLLAAFLGQRPNIREVLWRLYAQGVLPLDADVPDKAALLLVGPTAFTKQTYAQLLCSLELRVWQLLGRVLPSVAVLWCALRGLMVFAVTNAVAKCTWANGVSLWYPFAMWHLPHPWGTCMAMLYLGGLLTLCSASPLAVTFGRLCVAMARLVFTVQGVSLLWWQLRHKSGLSAGTSVLLCALALPIPMALEAVGWIDQVQDVRGIHHPPWDEDCQHTESMES